MKARKPTGISRIEIPEKSTFGYMVRLRRGDFSVNEFYSDSLHGGKRRAQKAAKSHYAEIAAIAIPANPSHKNVLTSRNSSGMVGLRISGADTNHSAWTAFWTKANGERKTVSFSLKKYGIRASKKMAEIARKGEITDRAEIEKIHLATKAAAKLARKSS